MNGKETIQINTKWVHLIYITVLIITLVISSVWAISGYRAELTLKQWIADAPVRDAVKIWVKDNTVSQKDFEQWKMELRTDLDNRFNRIEVLIKEYKGK